MTEIDAGWRAANPLPTITGQVSKNSRGRVLIVGGAASVPGAVRLTGEAALRAGAGKVKIATIASVAPLIGTLFPEAGIVALREDAGEITGGDCPALDAAAKSSDAVVLGVGMGDQAAATQIATRLAGADAALVLDAAAAANAGAVPQEKLSSCDGRLVLTPHEGEMASLTGKPIDEVRAHAADIAQEVAARMGAVVALKGTETHVAAPDGALLHYPGGGPGMATGGSGDVLAGIIGALLSRGATPLVATAWGVWLHGEAGRVLAGSVAPLGFLARELLREIPVLMPR
ncbi:yjeF C-terminal region, hydroxyethylthiazole kinase-related [Sphingomonas guangdongensis]|uniref:ADP-dependent (S)-NAD(P)H-hydrate dehydratase n=1 Tax=Sphingomonas guangdongensis TaxID=1141890 RepID=A0A285R0S6_9SPHN|nr:NAD(P)H-hydrate dehydratase [Sphingomonas guangdongensis]SOB87309.1 yjeF C-terminal region, hydroxyethylthiazole kinase-related [Sphingomonas guangdongensis]